METRHRERGGGCFEILEIFHFLSLWKVNRCSGLFSKIYICALYGLLLYILQVDWEHFYEETLCSIHKNLAFCLVQLEMNFIKKIIWTWYLQLMLIACRTPGQVLTFQGRFLINISPTLLPLTAYSSFTLKSGPTVMIADYRRPPCPQLHYHPVHRGSVWSGNELKASQANLWHCILYRSGWEQKQRRSVGWQPKSLLGRREDYIKMSD